MGIFAFTLSPAQRDTLTSGVESIFIAFVLASFLLVAGYAARQIRHGRLFPAQSAPLAIVMNPASAWLFTTTVVTLIYLQSILYAVVVLSGVAGALVESGRTLATQFGFYRMTLTRTVCSGLLIFGAVMLVEQPLTEGVALVLDRLNVPHPEQQAVQVFRTYRTPGDIFTFLIGAIVIYPVLEELFFRGFLLTFLKNYTSTWMAIILSGGVFAFAHLNLGVSVPLWFLGVVLGIAYEHTGSLLVPMTVHGCFNLATGLSLLLDRGGST
jgi:membrane protease YdiL (CAAX protease family)